MEYYVDTINYVHGHLPRSWLLCAFVKWGEAFSADFLLQRLRGIPSLSGPIWKNIHLNPTPKSLFSIHAYCMQKTQSGLGISRGGERRGRKVQMRERGMGIRGPWICKFPHFLIPKTAGSNDGSSTTQSSTTTSQVLLVGVAGYQSDVVDRYYVLRQPHNHTLKHLSEECEAQNTTWTEPSSTLLSPFPFSAVGLNLCN